jgi:mevalonate kinase
MKILVSVPGKIYLMGEHAVVYGKPAILAAISLRLSVSVEPADGLEIIATEPASYVRYAAEYVAKEYKLQKLPNVKITVTSAIPAGYHLGSSAAVAVGVVGALTYYLKKVWNPQAINQYAYEIEKKQHGNPSGADNTVVTTGGFLWYRKELEFLRSFWQLPFVLPSTFNHFYLIDTGRPKENTGEMVAYVQKEYRSHPARYKKMFDENEEQTKRITVALKDGDEKTLITSLRNGQRTLEEIGVVSKKITPLIRKIEHAGGAAKILGGGGRADGVGYLLCYSHHPPVSSIPIMLGEEGVKLKAKV